MGYGGAYWHAQQNRAVTNELAMRYVAGGGSIEETTRQIMYVLADYGALVVITEPSPGSFAVEVAAGCEGALRSTPSDNATAALGVGDACAEKLGHQVAAPGCVTHKFSLLGKKPAEAMTGTLGSVENKHWRNITNEISYLTHKEKGALKSHWEYWKEKGELKTDFHIVPGSTSAKWETEGVACAAVCLHLEDWRRFSVLQTHYLTGWNDNMKAKWNLVKHMLHSADCMFDFWYNFEYETTMNAYFKWDKQKSEICPQSGSGFRSQDMPIKALSMLHVMVNEMVSNDDSRAQRDKKVKAFSPRAWAISQKRSSGGMDAVGAIVCSEGRAEQMLESTRRHGMMVRQVWTDHFECAALCSNPLPSPPMTPFVACVFAHGPKGARCLDRVDRVLLRSHSSAPCPAP